MISVSTEFKQLMRTRTDFTEEAVITFRDSSTLTLTKDDFTITNNHVEDCAGANGIPLGAAIQKTIQIEIANFDDRFEDYDFFGAVIRLMCKFRLSNSTETVNYGKYTVISPETYGSTVILTASDDMYKANGKFTTGLSFPVTAQTLLNDVCTSCGISLASSNFRNRTFTITKLPEQDLTFRQVIGYIAMIAVGNARFNYDGYLEIKEYSFPLSSAQTLDMWSGNLSVSTDDIVVTGIKMQKDDQELTQGADGYCLVVENPLAADKESTFIQLIGNVMIGAAFRQFEGEHVGYPIAEFMDTVKVVDHKGNEYSSFLTDIQFNFCGATSFKNSAESPMRNSSKYSSAAARAFIQARELVSRERTAREAALEQLTDLVEGSSGLYSTIETLQDNSRIYYLHDKPSLSESMIVWKMTADTFVVSTDGGAHWNGGMTVDGDLIARILTVEGVNADWINAGTFVIRDSQGNIIFQASADTHSVYINGQYVQIGGHPLPDQIEAGVSAANAYTDSQLETYQTSVEERFEEIEGSLDGQIETWFYDYVPVYDPTTPANSNYPASSWTTEALREEHSGDCFVNTDTGLCYRFLKENGVWKWKMIEDTIATRALQDAARAQDTADHKRRVFYQTPTLNDAYDVGDLWVQGEDGDILRCAVAKVSGVPYSATHWVLASKYTDNSEFRNFVDGDYARTIEALQGQVDGKAETYYQATDPSDEWTTAGVSWIDHNGEAFLDHALEDIKLVYPEEAARHEGDLWHCTADIPNTPYKANTEWIWQDMEWKPMSVPDEVFDKIDGKATIWGVQPEPPYHEKDLWFTGTDIKYCVQTRLTGEYTASDWIKKDNYTDDSALNEWIQGDYAEDLDGLQTQIDKRAETWYQNTNPASTWTTPELKAQHKGDLWYCTGNVSGTSYKTGTTWRWSGTAWEQMDVPDAVFDKIDGKAQIFAGDPHSPYNIGDLWFQGANGDIKTCITARPEGYTYGNDDYNPADWVKLHKYTDDTLFTGWRDGAFAQALASLQGQIDGKAETWYQATDPSTGWASPVNDNWIDDTGDEILDESGDKIILQYEEERYLHWGDFWHKTTDNTEYILKEGVWERLDVPDQFFDLADGKATIFTAQPTVPYNKNDLWLTGERILVSTVTRTEGDFNAEDWIKKDFYTDDSAFNEWKDGAYKQDLLKIEQQADKKAETWYQSTDPSSAWTTADLRTEHVGDLWYDTTDGTTSHWNGTAWDQMDAPQEVFDEIDGKAAIYVSTPEAPYNVGDLWFASNEAGIMTCIRSREEGYTYQGGKYNPADWQERNKYTDNSAVNTFITTVYTPMVNDLKAQIDGKVETWYQDTDPAAAWTRQQDTVDEKWIDSTDDEILDSDGTAFILQHQPLTLIHEGDFWHKTTDNTEYIYKSGVWENLSVPDEFFDMADGKAVIFTEQPTVPYNKNDMWMTGTEILVSTVTRTEGSFVRSDWTKKDFYTDDSAFTDWKDTTYASTIQGFEHQMDGVIHTYNQTTDPSTGWDAAEKLLHVGDLWYNPQTKVTKRYSNLYSWETLENQAAIDAATLASNKRRVFVTTQQHPTPYGPYDVGDLWLDSTVDRTARLKMAKTATSTQNYYSASDWIECGYYTGADVDEAIDDYDEDLTQQEIFNRLTDNRQNQGIFLDDGNVYLNARMLGAELVEGDQIDAKKLRVVKEVTSGGQTQEVETLYIDADGKVSINAESLKISGKSVTQSIQESENLLEDPIDLSDTYWNKTGTRYSGISDPDGGQKAIGVEGSNCSVSTTTSNKPLKSKGTVYRFSVWLKAYAQRSVTLGINNSAFTKDVTVGTTWKKYTLAYEIPDNGTIASSNHIYIGGTSSLRLYIYNPRVEFTDPFMDQKLIMHQLTNDNNDQGIYLVDGKIYVNATYLRSLIITSSMIETGDLHSIGAKIGNFVIGEDKIYVDARASGASESFHSLDILNKNWDIEGLLGKRGQINVRSGTSNGSSYGFYINGDFIRAMVRLQILDLNPNADDDSIGISSGAHHTLGYTVFSNDADIGGSLHVTGDKAAIRDTEHYGRQTYHCYETPNPMFGDIGDGTLDETGTCIVSIDDIMQEAAATQLQYYVFLQKCGEGDCWVADRQPGYFVVRGTPGLTFSWELKAKQTGYESVRYNNGSDEIRKTNFTMPGYADMYAEELAAATQGMEETLYG